MSLWQFVVISEAYRDAHSLEPKLDAPSAEEFNDLVARLGQPTS